MLLVTAEFQVLVGLYLVVQDTVGFQVTVAIQVKVDIQDTVGKVIFLDILDIVE